jgi:hypothetical protein
MSKSLDRMRIAYCPPNIGGFNASGKSFIDCFTSKF